MSYAHRALFTALSPIPAGLVADFAAPCICEQILCCTKHDLGYWRNCLHCRESESSEPTDARCEVRPLCYHLMVMKRQTLGDFLEEDCDCSCPDRTNHTCGVVDYRRSRCKNMRAIAAIPYYWWNISRHGKPKELCPRARSTEPPWHCDFCGPLRQDAFPRCFECHRMPASA